MRFEAFMLMAQLWSMASLFHADRAIKWSMIGMSMANLGVGLLLKVLGE